MMDARDSSLAAAASGVVAMPRQGQVDDDGAALMVTSGLAKDAASLFQSGRYAECVEVLNQILQKKEGDPKVLHNIAIAEYYGNGCSDPKSLLDALKRVKKRSEDLARETLEESEISGVLHQTPSDGVHISYAEGVDTSITTLNTAIILFHLHEYARASSLLEPLYQKLHPLDETTALHVCLLLIDVALASNNASEAADVIQYMEKSFTDGYLTNQGDNGIALQYQSSNQLSRVSIPLSSLTIPDSSTPDSRVSENSFDRMLSEDAIEYETLLSTLDNSGQGMTRSTVNDLAAVPIDRPAPAADLKQKIHLYKVKLLLLTRNLKAAKREVKLGMNVARGRDSSIALLLKSQLEYARGNHRKAIKLLMTSSSKTDPGIFSMFNNNLGCIYHQLQKHHSAIALFSKALKREKPAKLSTFSQDKSPLISYNCGLQLLICKRPTTASRCFHVAAPALCNKPLLWLRLAECCIAAKSMEASRKSCSWADPVEIRVLGSGRWRRLAVETSPRNCLMEPSGDVNRDTLSLPFARQCLLNALLLLDRLGSKSTETPSHEGTLNVDHAAQGDQENDSRENKTAVDSSVSAFEGIRRKENNMIKQAALADLAYVELTLNNPLRALSAASELQRLPGCSRMFTFFSRVYAAEALCHLNRPKEAGDQLLLYVSEGNEVDFPYSEEDGMKWLGEKDTDNEESSSNGPNAIKQQTGPRESKFDFFIGAEEARTALLVNLGVLSAIQGDLDRARLFLRKALLAKPRNPQALAVDAYLDLRAGSTSNAVAKLKECSHIKFISNGITASRSR